MSFLFSGKHTPRWVIFLIDVTVCVFAFILAYLIRFEFQPPADEIDLAIAFIGIFLAVRAGSFILGKTYAGIIRYTSTQDSVRIFTVISGGTILFIAMNLLRNRVFDLPYFVPNSILLIEYLASLFALIVSRIAVKVLYLELKTPSKVKMRVVIFGAGESGRITKRAFDQENTSGIEVVAFLDDDKTKSGKKLEGVSIYHSKKAQELFASGKVDQIIISVQNIENSRKSDIIDEALKHNIQVMNVPPVQQWINGQLSVKQMRQIRIDDLLGRESIQLDSENVRQQIKGKRVLITGAAGSIGSELVRQVLAYEPSKVFVCDQAETPLFELDAELVKEGQKELYEVIVADVRNRERMHRVFEHCTPDIVYHAAAYKHVPLMEENPSEAVLTNVQGTVNMVDKSLEFNVERFVFVSTDKAVNPTNVMGATKRVAERYIKLRTSNDKTTFITTRFGNVLGSNGSVIPLFRKQIAEGGPVTVTHLEVTRYFMTIPEAVQLVLEAGAMGEGGEIFVFDMGQRVRIIDLAKNMIKLSGLELGKDIEIETVGLRPGEKLHEELLSNKENTLPTHHPKILRANHTELDDGELEKQIAELVNAFAQQNNDQIVKLIKQLVPEFRSQNSTFERLDS
jgi:FlaA1/EpsC-like NDP-sugar epimerase